MNILLILDRYGYRENELKYKKIFDDNNYNVKIIYTKYEDKIIRKVRNIPIFGNVLLHIFRWAKSLKYSISIDKMMDIDEIICLNPIVGILTAIIKRKKNKAKLIVCGFLFEDKKNKFYYNLRKKITKYAIKKISKIIVYGSKEVEHYSELFNIKNKFTFIPYGIDYMNQTEYKSNSLPSEYIFSGGGSNRDYSTLISAYNSSHCKYPLVIATQPWKLERDNINKCIILSDVVNETFGSVLMRSKLLILSLKDSNISAGHMVMLQAMSLGIPVLVNDIPAIRDYVDESCVEFYTSKDVTQLAKKINSYINSDLAYIKAKKSLDKYNQQYTSYALINRLIRLI